MKKKLKFGLGGLLLLVGVTALSGCTASFCSDKDKAHMLFAFDYGVTDYKSTGTEQGYYIHWNNDSTYEKRNLGASVFYTTNLEFCKTIDDINASAVKENIEIPSLHYWEVMDAIFLEDAFKIAKAEEAETKKLSFDLPANPEDLTAEQIRRDLTVEDSIPGLLDVYGYTKFLDEKSEDDPLWDSWNARNTKVRRVLLDEGVPDDAASNDYTKFYQSKMNGKIASYRSCLATTTDYYGAYGPHAIPVEIEGKAWTNWKGLLEFLFVWPIGAFIDVLTKGFLNMGTASGWAQVTAIFIVTIVIRSLILLATFKQTKSTAKMTELQPEITKIQQKYPNANTNPYEKQRMAQEMGALYKKNGVKPLGSLLVMIIQFPIFICVWGAMQGSAYLSSGSFLGLRLSDSIGSTMTNASSWSNGGGLTALLLFLAMSIAQAVAMLLPQHLQKKKAKDVAKLGRNPSQKSQANKMKWFTYIMLAMIIFMGFSLASGMGVYWFFGALFSIGQTLVTQSLAKKSQKKGKK